MPDPVLVITTDCRKFEQQLKKLEKQYPRIQDDLAETYREIQGGELHLWGDAIRGFSHKVWKKRVGGRSIGRGSRGGLRLIFYVDLEKRQIHPLVIYAKNERGDVPNDEIQRILESLHCSD